MAIQAGVQPVSILDSALLYARTGVNEGYLFFKIAVADMTRLVRNLEGVDSTLRFVEDYANLHRLLKKTESVASPMLERIGSVRSVIRLCRLSYSFNYIVSGQLYRDVVDKKIVPVVTEAAFLLGRTIGAFGFAVAQGVTTWESWAVKAGNIAGIRAFNLVMKLSKPKVLDGLFLVALSGLMVPEAKSLLRGEEKRDVHVLNFVSLAMDVGIIALELLDYKNKAVLLGMGLVAAGTAVWSFYADPANSSV